MAEFSLIERFCTGIGAQHPSTRIGVGDDAAVISVPESMELAISVDTMVEGVHFYADVAPAKLAHKLLAVNLSDLAAMGAQPKWATMTLTTPTVNSDWLAQFSTSLDTLAKQYGVQLIGGDTTQGQLNLSIQIMGLLPKGNALTRAGARVGDHVFVSNVIGDAALALRYLQKIKTNKSLDLKTSNDEPLTPALLTALEQPKPQLELGSELLGIANSSIDVSDGLVADLSHIAQKSHVSFELDVDQIPISDDYKAYLKRGGDLDLALTGGDDYQLAFTVPPEHDDLIRALAKKLTTPITKIGRVIKQGANPVNLVFENNEYKLKKNAGYQHFSD